MTRYAAFLRGVNLGKRQTKSADLKAIFEELGFDGVRTLISSGNVLFETKSAKGLKGKIETALEKRFGFAVGVVLRTHDELETMLGSKPFAKVDPEADVKFHVLMFAAAMAEPLPKLPGIPGDYDIARVDPREIYIVAHKKPDGGYLAGGALDKLDKLLPKGHLVTMRNWNTIEKAVG